MRRPGVPTQASGECCSARPSPSYTDPSTITLSTIGAESNKTFYSAKSRYRKVRYRTSGRFAKKRRIGASRNSPYYRVAADGCHEYQIRYLISYIRCEPGETSWAKLKAREREAIGRKDKEQGRRDAPLGQRRTELDTCDHIFLSTGVFWCRLGIFTYNPRPRCTDSTPLGSAGELLFLARSSCDAHE